MNHVIYPSFTFLINKFWESPYRNLNLNYSTSNKKDVVNNNYFEIKILITTFYYNFQRQWTK